MGDADHDSPSSPGVSPGGEHNAFNQSHLNDNDDAPSPSSVDGEASAKPHGPMQKRRRVTRACDECRRKKIKCDGKQPCTHCTVYSYDCTYDQPSNRRRNPAPQYIEALEQRLQKAEAILRSVVPGIDIDDPKFDARGVDQIIESAKTKSATKKPDAATKQDDEGQIQPMVDRVGSLDIDVDGNWDFHGHSSGFAFMRRFRAQFGEQYLPDPRMFAKNRTSLESPRSGQSSPFESNLSSVSVDLPPREFALELTRNTLDDCCALMRPIHRPTFFHRLDSIYETDPDQYSNEQLKFLPLLYLVMGVGCLFSRTETDNTMLDNKGYKEAIDQGYQYFNAGKQMLDITDCRDLVHLQTIFFMILFLQSTAKLSTCYAYLGIAMRTCCRLGLHRDIPSNKFNPIELEERRRLFWLIRKMDTYVGAMLGLPQMLCDEDIDQHLPLEVPDECITDAGISPIPKGMFPLVRATNAHTKLTGILRKVVRYIYPIKVPSTGDKGSKYTISHGRIRELERDLQKWMDELPMDLRPSGNAGSELSRVQQLLRISYAHVQMMMYRPFLHYVSHACQQGKADKRSFACAAACVSVAQNIVHITTEMKRRGLLVGAYWFVMYTTFFAIVSLVYFVLENPNSTTGQDILKDAMEGRETLASLAKRSMAADRCSMSLNTLFHELPEKLKERRGSHQPLPAGKKRSAPGNDTMQKNAATHNVDIPSREPNITPNRARTLPSDYLAKLAKRNSMPNSTPTGLNFDNIAPGSHNTQAMGVSSPMTASPLSQHFDFSTPQLAHSQIIPNLKNVMFPSDNPFAYPNQPISTLEAGDSSAYGFGDTPFSASTDGSMHGTPVEMSGVLPSDGDTMMQQQHQPQFGMSGFQRLYDENPQLATQLAAQQQQQQQGHRAFSVPSASQQQAMAGYGDLSGQQLFSESMGMPTATSQEDYWAQMSKGNMGNRTGFTPSGGVGGVNLDELFGGEGWGWIGGGENGL